MNLSWLQWMDIRGCKIKPILTLLYFLLASCANNQAVISNTEAWESFAYEGFGKKINRLAGADAVNCGVINQISKDDPVNNGNSLKKARACIEKSISQGATFKYATVKIPSDSYLFESLVFTPEKEFWIVHYDYILDGTSNMHVINRCKGLYLKKSDYTFQGIDCIEVPTSEWLSDIPEQKNK